MGHEAFTEHVEWQQNNDDWSATNNGLVVGEVMKYGRGQYIGSLFMKDIPWLGNPYGVFSAQWPTLLEARAFVEGLWSFWFKCWETGMFDKKEPRTSRRYRSIDE